MSARQLLRVGLLFVAVLVLWGAAALARRRGVAGAGGDGFRLPPMGRNTVDSVVLSRPGDTVVLARKDTATWTVNGHRAAPAAVAELFSALGDTAPGSELIAERRRSHAALGVDSAGTRVRVTGGGRPVADLIVGQRGPTFSGSYVRRTDQESTYLIRGGLVDAVTRPIEEWRDHRIAAVPADSVATVEISRGSRRYTLRRAQSGWSLSSGGRVDSAGVAALLAGYGTVDASGFASTAEASRAGFARPERRARLLRRDGTPIVALLFDSTATGFRVRSDTGTVVSLADGAAVERLTPAESTLRAPAAEARTR